MKIKCISLILLLSLVFASCSTTFDGYSYSIESVRNSESCYEKYDYIFTAEQENFIADFLISGDSIRIIKIDRKEKNDKVLYKIKNKSTFTISESLNNSKVQGDDAWIKTGNYPFQVEWMIATENTDGLQDGFKFIYNDTECVLLYRIVE